jgi:hypothetical protein
VFMETVEMGQRLRMIDANHLIQVETVLRHRADVILLRKDKPSRTVHRPHTFASAESRLMNAMPLR